jgi:DNA polymerase-4
MNKPDGMTVITRETVGQILPPLSVRRIWGIGPKAAANSKTWRKNHWRPAIPRRRFHEPHPRRVGRPGERTHQGVDERPVESDRDAKSIGQEETFGVDVIEKEHLRFVLPNRPRP